MTRTLRIAAAQPLQGHSKRYLWHPMLFARRKKQTAPAPAPVASAQARDRRQVSGVRVLCRCSLVLPKLDPFSAFRARCEGFFVLNVRGGSLYLAHPFTEESASRAFPPESALPVKEFTLYPPQGEPIRIGTLRVRYLKLSTGERLTGLVLRFVGLDESQLDALNGLPARCPTVVGDEESIIPEKELHRM